MNLTLTDVLVLRYFAEEHSLKELHEDFGLPCRAPRICDSSLLKSARILLEGKLIVQVRGYSGGNILNDEARYRAVTDNNNGITEDT